MRKNRYTQIYTNMYTAGLGQQAQQIVKSVANIDDILR